MWSYKGLSCGNKDVKLTRKSYKFVRNVVIMLEWTVCEASKEKKESIHINFSTRFFSQYIVILLSNIVAVDS